MGGVASAHSFEMLVILNPYIENTKGTTSVLSEMCVSYALVTYLFNQYFISFNIAFISGQQHNGLAGYLEAGGLSSS